MKEYIKQLLNRKNLNLIYLLYNNIINNHITIN